MKVLIVNCFKRNNEGRKLYKAFYKLIVKVYYLSLFQQVVKMIKDLNKLYIDTDIICFERTRYDLDDILYEQNSVFCHDDAARRFDSIEAIYLAGDQNILPWEPSMRKIQVLLRMCLISKKLLFVSGAGFQALLFLCASNIDHDFKIINGNGRGGIIDQKIDIPMPLSQVQNHDYILDKVTGDLFTYSHENRQWLSKGNSGLHHAQTAKLFIQKGMGQYICKKKIYRPPAAVKCYQKYLSKNTERICYIRKKHMQHWAVKNSEKDFKIPSQNHWVIHNFNFVNAEKTFIHLGDSDDSLQIICSKDSILGCFFNVDIKYPNTLLFLKNFTAHVYNQLQTFKYTNITKIYQDYNIQQKFTSITVPTVEIKVPGIKGSTFIYAKCTHQSGMSFSTRHGGIRTVANNAVSLKTGLQIKKTVVTDFSDLFDDLKQFHDRAKENLDNEKQSSTTTFFKTQPKFFKKRNSVRPPPFQYQSLIKFRRNLNVENKFFHVIKGAQDQAQHKIEEDYPKPEFSLTNATIGEIRKFLHPGMSDEYCHKKIHWIPGRLTYNRENDRIQAKRKSIGNLVKNQKQMGQLKKIKKHKRKRRYSSYHKFQKIAENITPKFVINILFKIINSIQLAKCFCWLGISYIKRN